MLPFAGITLFGCASIIGLDEYTVASHGGSSGTDGGEAGAAPGEAGAAPAGESGAGGVPGAAGAGDTLQVVGCDGTTPFEPNLQVVRSCLLRAGCDPSFNPLRTISTCVTKDTQKALPGESCNLTSTTCADYEACEHIGVAHEDLCGPGKKTRCEGDRAINCGNYAGDDRFFDCGASGATCSTFAFSDADATIYADCQYDVSPDSCVGKPDVDTSRFCHSQAGLDDVNYYCWGGKAYGTTCQDGFCSDPAGDAAGAGGASSEGNASCFFTTPSCTAPKTPTCTNGVATVCSSGSLFKYDCAAVGLGCSTTSGSEYCLAPGCTSTDVETGCQESCSDDGSQLTFCYGGTPVTVKCTDYGFTQCLTGMDDKKNPFAACRF